MKFVALITARGGSKGIPGKNLRLLAGLPLIAHTIKFAQSFTEIGLIVVSSDDDEILKTAESFGARTLKRPSEFALDTSTSDEVIEHFIMQLKFKEQTELQENIILLQPTSPLRKKIHLSEGIKKYSESKGSCILAIAQYHVTPMRSYSISGGDGELKSLISGESKRRQDYEKYYAACGSFYIFSKNNFMKLRKIPMDRPCGVIVERPFDLDIDLPLDLDYAEFLVKRDLSLIEY